MATFLDIGLAQHFSVIFPVLFVFVIVFALLEKSKILGDNKGLHSLIALCLAIMLLFVPGLAKVLIINKVDLLPYVECSIERMVRDVKTLNRDLEIFEISCTDRTGLGAWKEWLTGEIKNKKHKSLLYG